MNRSYEQACIFRICVTGTYLFVSVKTVTCSLFHREENSELFPVLEVIFIRLFS